MMNRGIQNLKILLNDSDVRDGERVNNGGEEGAGDAQRLKV